MADIIVDNEAQIVKQTRRSPDLKDKTIEFSLTKEMRLADLVEKGYQRKEVEALFQTMQENGLGVYEKGRLGRGCSGKFICNDGFPEKCTIVMQVRRLRQNYIGKPQVEVANEPSVIFGANASFLTQNEAAPSNNIEPVIPQANIEQEIAPIVA